MTSDEIKHRMAWLRQEATNGGRVAVGDDTLAEIAEIERLALCARPEALAKTWHAEAESLRREVGAKQAVIDRLMLEYCPKEITPEQLEEWKKHQCSIPSPLREKT